MSIDPSVKIHPSARIDCTDITIGAGGVVGAGCIIEGRRVEIGRELWMDEGARIGGGSCRDPQAFLRAGDFLHLGKGSELNTARGITIGDEVGVGVGSMIFTHGAYLDELAGFPCAFEPVVIGSRVWLPNAWVNPGVTIGDDVVVGARSLVSRPLPSGCLAAGTPAKVIMDGVYPMDLPDAARFAVLDRIADEARLILGDSPQLARVGHVLIIAGAHFDTAARGILGEHVTAASEVVRHQLRRHGIRFRFSPSPDGYVPWTAF